jgi:urea carboxylase
MFRKVLVANRGAIACRIIRTLRQLGIASVAVYSEADRHSQHRDQADEAVFIGPSPAAQSYLSIPAILEAARGTETGAIHPGYGFLSENAGFAQACQEHGIVFIGPTPQHIRSFGLKHTARQIAAAQGIPMLPGSGLLGNPEAALHAAAEIGYPVMLKSTAGGGGIGMRVCSSAAELREAFPAVVHMSQVSFGASGLYLERFVAQARHIEIQVFGDGCGSVVALGERDCSVQRRNQKVIEETPAPGLSPASREEIAAAAIRLARAVNYQSAGTVEFIYDCATKDFYFLEVNTRLQVEHGITEEVLGIDLVEWMVRQAAGEQLCLNQVNATPSGCSIQARIYAEDPGKDFQPGAGKLSHVIWPKDARVETWIEAGTEVTPYYDPMLAKLIVRGPTRAVALDRLRRALRDCELGGIETNLPYLRQACEEPPFIAGGVTTSFLKDLRYRRSALEVVEPGTQTTIQDYPGRTGYWHVGVPPSGPMDILAFRLVNRLVGNGDDEAGLEVTITGPTLRFDCDTTIALGGADLGAKLDGKPVPPWQAVRVSRGAVLTLGGIHGQGMRAYLAVAGGLNVPRYLGSRSTFILGKFGGHCGRILRSGDVLHLGDDHGTPRGDCELPQGLVPRYAQEWEIGVLYGPHGMPDFFAPEDIDMFFVTQWKVHYNSDRTGIRLIGPKPKWAREDGGEAGLHPSNIHDNAYAIGTIDFTGDMPVILGPDGPSLGGFVCPATVVESELWKIGQLKAGDLVRFRRLTLAQADELHLAMESCIGSLQGELPVLPLSEPFENPVLRNCPPANGAPGVVCRADGDRYLLLEYGPNILDLNLRFRVHALEETVRAMNLPGITDLTPGVRSLQIHYSSRLSRDALLEALDEAEHQIPDLDDITAKARVVHLPLSWDDPATRLAIRKYTQSVRPDAPWCPSNIEFIRRINGLDSIDDVRRIVYDASYLVLGLGDVYLGAPVATPLDPRHRLVTTKYNPARTWTPENAVGIGGAYLCVYGMEGPGGYQFVGRTLQMWNTFRSTAEFSPGKPWLLRCFDRISFFPATAEELLEIREDFPRGRYSLRLETAEFRLREYHAFLAGIAKETAAFKTRQQEAFNAERERWAASGKIEFSEPSEPPILVTAASEVPEGCNAIRSPITASIWNVAVEPGQRVDAGQRLIVLESMKMEIAVVAPCPGIVEVMHCSAGAIVTAGQILLALRVEASA